MKTCRELKCICFKCPELRECFETYCKGRIIEPDCQGYKYCAKTVTFERCYNV